MNTVHPADTPFKNWLRDTASNEVAGFVERSHALEIFRAAWDIQDANNDSGSAPSTGEVCWEVITKSRTDEERSMILVGLRMIKRVTKAVPDPDDPNRFVVYTSNSNPSISIMQAMIVIEGVVKVEHIEK